MTLMSLIPIKEKCNVLGIGVAVRVNVSTNTFCFLIFSLIATPNFCSSSTINKPKSLDSKLFPTAFWVPINMSVFPSLYFLKTSLSSFPFLNLET